MLYAVPTTPAGSEEVTTVSGSTVGPEFAPDPLPVLGEVIVTLTGFDLCPDLLSCTINCTTAGSAMSSCGTGAASVLPFTTLVESVLPFHKMTASLEKFSPTTVIVTAGDPATSDPGSTLLMLGVASEIDSTPHPTQNISREMPTLATTIFNFKVVKVAPLKPFLTIPQASVSKPAIMQLFAATYSDLIGKDMGYYSS